MSIGWRIFKALNIIEAAVIISLIGLGLVFNPIPLNNQSDFYLLATLLAIVCVLAMNCIGNILMANLYKNARKLTKAGTVLFWINTILFAGLLAFMAFLLNEFFKAFEAPNSNQGKNLIPVFYTILPMLINGIVIFIFQFKLYFNLRKKHLQNELQSIESIGALTR